VYNQLQAFYGGKYLSVKVNRSLTRLRWARLSMPSRPCCSSINFCQFSWYSFTLSIQLLSNAT